MQTLYVRQEQPADHMLGLLLDCTPNDYHKKDWLQTVLYRDEYCYDRVKDLDFFKIKVGDKFARRNTGERFQLIWLPRKPINEKRIDEIKIKNWQKLSGPQLKRLVLRYPNFAKKFWPSLDKETIAVLIADNKDFRELFTKSFD